MATKFNVAIRTDLKSLDGDTNISDAKWKSKMASLELTEELFHASVDLLNHATLCVVFTMENGLFFRIVTKEDGDDYIINFKNKADVLKEWKSTMTTLRNYVHE